MSQNQAVHKTDTLDVPSHRTFLSALYRGCPQELYFELRAIHPTTQQAKALWGQLSNKRELAAILKHAEVLNKEGYGMYFAPCLRQSKQGKVETTALVPALWVDIDCEGDLVKREVGLAVLKDFDLPPSFIIDSGGGWHGYWLLDQPFVLRSEAERQKIASILRGLFAALGGDPSYVKSVASIMRLPDSVNTKPERDGAVVKIVQSQPDRRYALETFAWLESQPKPDNPSRGGTITQTGQHTLPPRTEAYLVSGAPEHQRNHELFAAACQYRDAGRSQSETERDLIPRYVADGCPEKEGLKTIASVYSRPAREPLAQSRETARQQLDALEACYGQPSRAREHPSPEQIEAVVQACAGLSPVQWAVERQRLKSLCGHGIKTADLDRMYRQTQRDVQSHNTSQEGMYDMEHYFESEGRMIYRYQTSRGLAYKVIADWTGRVRERITRMKEEGESEHDIVLELRAGTHTCVITVPGDVFGDDLPFRRFLAGQAGIEFISRANMGRHLSVALLSLSGEYPTRLAMGFMGWTQLEDRWTYVTPDLALTANTLLDTPPQVDLETRLRDYRFRASSWQDSLKAFEALITVIPANLAPTCIAFALLPVVQRFFPAAAPRPALHLVGTTGSGKSEIAALLCSFYGQFYRDAPPAQWGDTINTVEALGYQLADALYWVDDYKTIYADEKTFTRFLQSYSRGMGRGRLTREAKVRRERPCRGLVLSTGETMIAGEASVIARTVMLEIPPWEKRDPNGAALDAMEPLRGALSGFTVRFAQWVAEQVESHQLVKTLDHDFAESEQVYRTKLGGLTGRHASTGRIIQNWAVLVTVYRLLHRFLVEQKAVHVLPPWQHRRPECAVCL